MSMNRIKQSACNHRMPKYRQKCVRGIPLMIGIAQRCFVFLEAYASERAYTVRHEDIIRPESCGNLGNIWAANV